MVLPERLLRFNNNFLTSTMPIGSSPFVGSSRIRSSGLPSNAMPKSRRRLMPIEKLLTRFLPVLANPMSCKRLSTVPLCGISHSIQRTIRLSRALRFGYDTLVSGMYPMRDRNRRMLL